MPKKSTMASAVNRFKRIQNRIAKLEYQLFEEKNQRLEAVYQLLDVIPGERLQRGEIFGELNLALILNSRKGSRLTYIRNIYGRGEVKFDDHDYSRSQFASDEEMNQILLTFNLKKFLAFLSKKSAPTAECSV